MFIKVIHWLRNSLLALISLLLVLSLAGIVYQVLATARDVRRYPPPGQLIDVGGYQMHLYCTGERQVDRPTVILDASYPATVSSWVWIQPQLTAVTRVCAYDRAGTGWSDSSPNTLTIGQMAEDLHTLLEKSSESAPYLLIGHSWGGGVTRLFAATYPQLVRGLVQIEATHPETWSRRGLPDSTLGGMPPAQVASIPLLARLGIFRLLPALRGSWGIVPGLPEQQQAELIAYFNTTKWANEIVAVEKALPESLEQLRQVDSVGNMPLLLVIGSISEEATGVGLELQVELGKLSTNSQTFWVEGADHSSLVHDPELAQQTGTVILEWLRNLPMEN